MQSTSSPLTLGSYLKAARDRKKLTATEVARRTGQTSPLKVLMWERDAGHALPLPVLRDLVDIYELDHQLVLDLLLRYQIARIEEKFLRLARQVL
jgi:transcriptional regulator with XRE-family HTH domain